MSKRSASESGSLVHHQFPDLSRTEFRIGYSICMKSFGDFMQIAYPILNLISVEYCTSEGVARSV